MLQKASMCGKGVKEDHIECSNYVGFIWDKSKQHLRSVKCTCASDRQYNSESFVNGFDCFAGVSIR